MDNLKLLITGAGYLGASTLIKKLKENGEREITVIGTDANKNSAAQFYCDKFYSVPFGEHPKFIDKIYQICREEKIDIILPGTSQDVFQLAFYEKELERAEVKLLASSCETARIAINKYKTYEALKDVLTLPQYIYSKKGYLLKPLEGKGGRGIETIEKEGLMMEKLKGEEIDADALYYKGELLLNIIKTRERTYGGTLIEGKIVDRPSIVHQLKIIGKILNLDYLTVVQFIDNKLLEVNPRIAGAVIYPEDWNMPYLAIKLGLGEMKPEEIKSYQPKVPFGLKVARYMEQKEY